MNDRQQRKRDYLSTPTRAGVYAIRHLASGRLLVEGSPNVDGALNRHRFELRMGAHRNAALQRDWAAQGESGFAFEVVDRVKPRDEPGFDATRELAALVALWQQELVGAEGAGYAAPQRSPACAR